MKILVTGFAGFIGSNAAEYLLNKGHKVVGIDNFNDFYDPKIKEFNAKDFINHPNFSAYREDILDVKKLDEIFEKENIEAIIHLAAWPGVTDSLKMPTVHVRNNIEGTVTLCEAAVKYGIKSFVFASTSSVYGSKNQTPFVETMNTDLALAPYPATKKACEVMLSSYTKNNNLNVTIFRIFNPIGLRLRPDLALPKMIRSCLFGVEFPMYWSDPKSTSRDYTYLPHLLDAMLHCCENPFEYEIFNLGNSDPVSLDDVRKAVDEVVGKPVNVKIMPPRFGEMLITYANVDKAKKMIGYNPSTSLKDMVKIYYDWFVKQPESYQKGEF